jgi:heme/copper-type cytochrome/quinol oxidase subunit 2
MVALALVPLANASAAPTQREIEMKGSLFEWDPPVIRVNKGDHVVLRLTSTDVVHGIFLDGYDLDVKVEPGKVTTLEFVADKSGKFRYRCSFTCGNLHPFMIGELIVEPNNTYLGAIGLAVLVATGSLAFVWARKEESR